eukprot:gene13822-biopygen12532
MWEAPEPAEHARTAGKVGGDAEGRDGSAKMAKVVGDEAGCEGDGICGTSQKTQEAVEAWLNASAPRHSASTGSPVACRPLPRLPHLLQSSASSLGVGRILRLRLFLHVRGPRTASLALSVSDSLRHLHRLPHFHLLQQFPRLHLPAAAFNSFRQPSRQLPGAPRVPHPLWLLRLRDLRPALQCQHPQCPSIRFTPPRT